MTCAEVDRLVDRFVDGRLDARTAGLLEAHASGCPRCARAVARARRLARGLAEAPRVRAPRGFAASVMNEIWRRELWSPAKRDAERTAERRSASEARPRSAPAAMAAWRYRRLGISFVLSAAVLSAALLVPQLAGRAGIATSGESFVRIAIEGANGAVRNALSAAGSPAAGLLEGRTP